MDLGHVENGEFDRQFGARVRDLRGDAITQEQVAYLGGFSVSTVSKIERGLLGVNTRRLPDLARALGVSVAELFTFEGARVRLTHED